MNPFKESFTEVKTAIVHFWKVVALLQQHKVYADSTFLNFQCICPQYKHRGQTDEKSIHK